MFDLGDGGVGFQLSMYRLADAFRENAQDRREGELHAYANRVLADRNQLATKYNELLAYAQGLEQAVKQRDEALAETKAALHATQGRLDFEIEDARLMRRVRSQRAREREQELDRANEAGSQLPSA